MANALQQDEKKEIRETHKKKTGNTGDKFPSCLVKRMTSIPAMYQYLLFIKIKRDRHREHDKPI